MKNDIYSVLAMEGFETATSDQDRKDSIEASLNELVNGGPH